MKKYVSKGWRSSNPLYWLNHKHLRILIIFCISQIIWIASAELLHTPPTMTWPQWFAFLTYFLLSQHCLCHFLLLPHLQTDGVDRNDICLYEKRQNSEVLYPTQQSASGYKWLCQAAFWSYSLVFSTVLLAAEAVHPTTLFFLALEPELG